MTRLLAYYTVIAAALAACLPKMGWSREELSRTTSPDSIVDAVVVRANGGATTAFIYEVYVVPRGEDVAERQPVFNAEHVDGLGVRWRRARLLELRYRAATIFHFTNFWGSKDVNNFRYVTEIMLRPATDGRSLSVYNRSTEDKTDTLP